MRKGKKDRKIKGPEEDGIKNLGTVVNRTA